MQSAKNRDVMGAPIQEAAKGTIRADLATSIDETSSMAPDAPDTGGAEIGYFFRELGSGPLSR